MRGRVALIAFLFWKKLYLLTIYPKDMIEKIVNCRKDFEPLR